MHQPMQGMYQRRIKKYGLGAENTKTVLIFRTLPVLNFN